MKVWHMKVWHVKRRLVLAVAQVLVAAAAVGGWQLATDSANASASAFALPYQTSSNRRVSAASVAVPLAPAGDTGSHSPIQVSTW